MSLLPVVRTWGLTVPGRSATPSEGHAQAFARIGPADSQALLTFANGTCLSFGPNDIVDEFAPGVHPFGEQVLMIDKAIRDCKAERTRHEGVDGDRSATDRVFDNFRCQQADPSLVSMVHLPSGPYLQVPSRYASVSRTPSIYATPNKADIIGSTHPGMSSDTRFGVLRKPSPAPRPFRPFSNQPRARYRSRHASRQRRGNRPYQPLNNGSKKMARSSQQIAQMQPARLPSQHQQNPSLLAPIPRQAAGIAKEFVPWETPVVRPASLGSSLPYTSSFSSFTSTPSDTIFGFPPGEISLGPSAAECHGRRLYESSQCHRRRPSSAGPLLSRVSDSQMT